jgi:ribosome-binding factor A
MTKRTRGRARTSTNRDYPRTARLNQLFQEILAEELEKVDDERLELVTIMSVDCEGDLRRATVYYDSLGGAEDDERVLEALGDVRHRLQGAIGRQARVKRTPELIFKPDDVSRGAARLEAVFRTIQDLDDDIAVHRSALESSDSGSSDTGSSDTGSSDTGSSTDLSSEA